MVRQLVRLEAWNPFSLWARFIVLQAQIKALDALIFIPEDVLAKNEIYKRAVSFYGVNGVSQFPWTEDGKT